MENKKNHAVLNPAMPIIERDGESAMAVEEEKAAVCGAEPAKYSANDTEIGFDQRIIEDVEAENDEESELILHLRKPYLFEGKQYTQVDLRCIEDVTGAQLDGIAKFVTKKNAGANPATIEMTMEYAQVLAARVTKLPIVFFKGLPARDAIGLKNAVVGFLYGGD